mmetsp:Transcript_18432/g.45264  ORF Transcript_18432/g.45264 Transcript_18432/m.45264 type:complete len:100 (+) Transcript_18432:1000-1299(+)
MGADPEVKELVEEARRIWREEGTRVGLLVAREREELEGVRERAEPEERESAGVEVALDVERDMEADSGEPGHHCDMLSGDADPPERDAELVVLLVGEGL